MIPGTEIVVKAGSDGKFIQDVGKSFLQILYEDSQKEKPPNVLQPDSINRLWINLMAFYEEGEDSFSFFDDVGRRQFMRHFYRKELVPDGAEAEDLEGTLRQLHWEMRYNFLFMNALVVVRNDKGLIENLSKTQLPTTIQPVSAYTKTTIPIDPIYGISLKEFRDAGGTITAEGTTSSPRYVNEKDWDVMAVRWMLGQCEVDGPSSTYDLIPLESRFGPGVLRGKNMASEKIQNTSQ